VNVGLRDKPRVTPLSYVLDAERPTCLELLVSKGGLFTPENTLGLMIPIQCSKLLRRLHVQNVDLNQDFGLGQGTLDAAISLQDVELVALFLNSGALSNLYWAKDSEEIIGHAEAAWYPNFERLLANQMSPVLSASCNLH
jgi:hypothetical protein